MFCAALFADCVLVCGVRKVLIALAKLGRNLGAYKVARHAFEKLQVSDGVANCQSHGD